MGRTTAASHAIDPGNAKTPAKHVSKLAEKQRSSVVILAKNPVMHLPHAARISPVRTR